jgi:hypothetical protein
MRVKKRDGKCRSCGSELEIVDVDDATMTVECQSGCGDVYAVEPDAFGDGCMTYYLGMVQEKYDNGENEE